MRQQECVRRLFTLKEKGIITKQEYLDYYGKISALPKSGNEVQSFADSLPKPTYEQEVLFQTKEQSKNILSIKNNVQFFAWLAIISLVLGVLILFLEN